MNTLLNTEQLVQITCGECSIRFAMPASMQRRAYNDHNVYFWCPNGHKIGYLGDTDAEKEIERLRSTTQWLRDERDASRRIAEAERRRAIAYKGHVTRMRNRVANGICPKAGCQRSFTQLADHVKTCHPELVDVLEVTA